jgi:hypothetical protein
MEATEAERIALRDKKKMIPDSQEERYVRDLKALILFLRYDIILGEKDIIKRDLFFCLKGRLNNRLANKLERLAKKSFIN